MIPSTSMTFVAQIFGILYFLFDFLSTSQAERKKVFFYNFLSNIMAIIEYTLLFAWNGVICCMVAVLRNFIFSKFKKVPTLIIIGYIVIAIIINSFFINSVIDILPVINISLVAIALSEDNIIKLKYWWLITCILSFIYDTGVHAYASSIFDVVSSISIIVFLINYKKLLKKEKELKRQSNFKKLELVAASTGFLIGTALIIKKIKKK